MGKFSSESLRTYLSFTVYTAATCYLISKAIQSYVRLEKKELGTIYKVDVPGFVIYPSIVICPYPHIEDLMTAHTVNETWNVPQPNMRNILTHLEHSYNKNGK